MFVYFIFIIFVLFLSFIAYKVDNPKHKKFIIACVFLLLFSFSAFRYNVGADYRFYVRDFYLIKGGYTSRFEILFLFINKFIIFMFDNPDWVFIISSFITFFLIFKSINNESSKFFISIIILFASRFYLYSFTQVRQYIAIAIFLYSLKYIINGNWKKYFFLIAIAFGFHKSALIYFFIYFFRYLHFEKKQYIIICILAPFLNPIVKYLYLLFGSTLFGNYISEEMIYGHTPVVFIATGIIFTLIPILVFNKIKTNEKNNLYLNIQLLSWIIIVAASSFFESYRIIAMFIYISILLIPECYEKMNKKIRFVFLVIFLMMAIYTSYLMIIYPDSSFIPYQTIFNK